MKYHYSLVRYIYLDTLDYLSGAGGESDLNLSDKLAEDLGLWGDDNAFLLEDFVDRFQLDYSAFNYAEHFERETELITIGTQLITPFLIAGWLIWKIIERAFPGCPTPNVFDDKLRSKNPRKDLTVGDLITWRLTGRFQLRTQADIRTY